MIRGAGPSDAPRLAAIYNQAVRNQQNAATREVDGPARALWLAGPARRAVWVAELDGQVAGYLSLSDWRGRQATRHTAEVSYYIDEAAHRRGLASALMAHALTACPAMEIDRLIAILLADNAPSLAFLAKLGFEEWGRLPSAARFDERRVDHLIVGRVI